LLDQAQGASEREDEGQLHLSMLPMHLLSLAPAPVVARLALLEL